MDVPGYIKLCPEVGGGGGLRRVFFLLWKLLVRKEVGMASLQG